MSEWFLLLVALASIVVILITIKTSIGKRMMDGLSKRYFSVLMSSFTKAYNKRTHSRKKQLFSSLEEHLVSVKGDIVEIGVGTGANFQFYPANCSVIALDPNPHMESFLVQSVKACGNINLKKFILCQGEDLREIEDSSVSVVVLTLVLCSVESGEKVLDESIRILKPGGRVYFLEHVKGKGLLLTIQRICNVFWPYIADGCRLLDETEELIRKAGFKKVECERFNVEKFNPLIRPHIMGFAQV